MDDQARNFGRVPCLIFLFYGKKLALAGHRQAAREDFGINLIEFWHIL